MPLSVSARAKNVIASPIRKFTPLIRAAEQAGASFFKMHIGDPDLDAPAAILKAIRGYDKKTIPYTPSSGLPEHVAAWSAYYKKLGVDLPPERIVPTMGCAEAIHMAMLVACDPGDEVIVFEPLYTGFKASAGMHGVKLVPVPLDIKDGFLLKNAAAIEGRVTSRTKAIIVINPDNPTGKCWNKAELEIVIDVAEKHDLIIFSDETYREIVFRGKPRSLLSFPRARQRTVLLDSLSKRFSIPGARMGCIASANPDIAAAALKFAMARLSAPTIEQLAVIPMLRKPDAYVTKIVTEYRKRRDTVMAGLRRMKGVKFHVPEGAFYAVAALPIDDAEDFVKFLINDFRDRGRSVTVTPIKDFYISDRGRNEIRIAYVLSVAKIKEAMKLLAKGLAAYQAKK